MSNEKTKPDQIRESQKPDLRKSIPSNGHRTLDYAQDSQDANVIRNTMPAPKNPNSGGSNKDKK
jgi:hypothetical protein